MKRLFISIQAAVDAGKTILDIYHTDFMVSLKDDNSPLTLADQRAHKIIVRYLKPIDIPILSEEGRNIQFCERKDWEQLWIVDPLDGTKEFINRNGEFTVNIALTENGKPLSGVVYLPVKDRLYFADHRIGAYRLENAITILRRQKKTNDPPLDLKNIIDKSNKLPVHAPENKAFTIVGSRSHPSPELDAFVEKMRREHDTVKFISAGSSLKFCLVAEGRADIYPRFGPTMEWDTAAGQAIAENAGIRVLDYQTGLPLLYNKENLLNPWFMVKP